MCSVVLGKFLNNRDVIVGRNTIWLPEIVIALFNEWEWKNVPSLPLLFRIAINGASIIVEDRDCFLFYNYIVFFFH